MTSKLFQFGLVVVTLGLLTVQPVSAGQYDKDNPFKSFGARSYGASKWQRQQSSVSRATSPRVQTPSRPSVNAQPTYQVRVPATAPQRRLIAAPVPKSDSVNVAKTAVPAAR